MSQRALLESVIRGAMMNGPGTVTDDVALIRSVVEPFIMAAEVRADDRRRVMIASQLANQKRYVTPEGAVAILLADAMAVCGYPDSDSFDLDGSAA